MEPVAVAAAVVEAVEAAVAVKAAVVVVEAPAWDLVESVYAPVVE